MPFGSADRAVLAEIARQVKDIGESLAVLKQQAADQQHTIDQIRQDTTAAITTGLAEVRSVARDAMTRTTDLVTGPLTHINSEIVGVRGTLGHIEGQLQASADQPAAEPETATSAQPDPPLPAPKPGPTPEPAPEPAAETSPDTASPDPSILQAAAGIAHVTVEAHRDTWAFLIQAAGNEEHFHIPGKVDDHDGFVSVRFSGPSLVAAITSLDHIAHTAPNPVTQAIARHIGQKITTAVEEILTAPASSDDGKPVRIVIDDRAAPGETGERAAGE
ncbi:hypothetical protein [Streptomyces sp. NPDC000351]|uniref:hypothetical protein n=1 Tax=Streptomyces sp. NPDC000351 TaxID=3154250 RepID=UPI003331C762